MSTPCAARIAGTDGEDKIVKLGGARVLHDGEDILDGDFRNGLAGIAGRPLP